MARMNPKKYIKRDAKKDIEMLKKLKQKKPLMIAITGPASSGKTTLIDRVLETLSEKKKIKMIPEGIRQLFTQYQDTYPQLSDLFKSTEGQQIYIQLSKDISDEMNRRIKEAYHSSDEYDLIILDRHPFDVLSFLLFNFHRLDRVNVSYDLISYIMLRVKEVAAYINYTFYINFPRQTFEALADKQETWASKGLADPYRYSELLTVPGIIMQRALFRGLYDLLYPDMSHHLIEIGGEDLEERAQAAINAISLLLLGN